MAYFMLCEKFVWNKFSNIHVQNVKRNRFEIKPLKVRNVNYSIDRICNFENIDNLWLMQRKERSGIVENITTSRNRQTDLKLPQTYISHIYMLLFPYEGRNRLT